ncbi:unnamed protein product [Thelazia callipaeda]|uniref:BTB domain-containing protein n=1 Tax=Thelazia callipaeda TaxID=103827 RepID=A0A0N5D2P4_THECL|nr:unnamed protein product [Thelazia callipaeda]
MTTSNSNSSRETTVVRLNVGGSLFSTTAHTLLREENSIFPQLLHSQTNGLEKMVIFLSDGTIFIDRDGSLFTHILEYLRLSKLILPQNFQDYNRLHEEAKFYRLSRLEEQIIALSTAKYISLTEERAGNIIETGGYITIGFRGTLAFGRDGQAEVKFRKLHRILVCGKAALCREVFGNTLNESRDPDRDGQECYTSRLYLKHQCLEKACDILAEKGFKLVATRCNGANGFVANTYNISNQGGTLQQPNGKMHFDISESYFQSKEQTKTLIYFLQELINQRNTGDLEEQRWANYTEYIFFKKAICPSGISPLASR